MVSNEAPMPPIWDAEMEVHFFQSLQGHKPCGINKHFHMTCIQEKLFERTNMMIPTKYLWEHLYSMWDIDILDSAQESPFPENKLGFVLPFETAAEDLTSDCYSEDSASESKNTKKRSPLPPAVKKKK